MIKIVPKVWGKEEWLVNNELYCAKFLYVSANSCCSLHFHRDKDEEFYMISGSVLLEKNDNKITMNNDDSVRIKPFDFHRFIGINKKSKILEVSTHHEDDDSDRLEPSRKLT